MRFHVESSVYGPPIVSGGWRCDRGFSQRPRRSKPPEHLGCRRYWTVGWETGSR